MSIAQCIVYNTGHHWHGVTFPRELLYNHRPMEEDRLHTTETPPTGALVTISIGDPGETILPHGEPLPEIDMETDESDFGQYTLTCTTPKPGLVLRPNAGLVIDHDDLIPYDRHFSNGDHFSGRIIPPPRWHEQPIVRQAAEDGAVRRNGAEELMIHCRSWLLPHGSPAVRQPRDLVIRAQLVVQLLDRLRRLWSDYVGSYDAARLYLVSPTPSSTGTDTPRIHVILERNRPIASNLRPILMSFQEITAEGLSQTITWLPILSPPAFTLQDIQFLSHLNCEAHHLLIPRAASVRGWMTTDQQRHVVPGAFIPVWWDQRRPDPNRPPQNGQPEEEHDEPEHNALLQFPPQQEDREADHEEGLILMQRGTMKRSRTKDSSPSTTPTIQAFHVFRLSTSYVLMPAPRPGAGADVPGYLLGLMSKQFGFSEDEPASCHPVRATVDGLQNLPTFIYEHVGDRFSQQYTDDILALVDIDIRGVDRGDHRIRRVLWLRTASTRMALLATLRCGDICEVMDPPCKVYLNNGFWPELDSVRRHFDYGDYLHIIIEANKPVEETLSCLRTAEIQDRNRRIFLNTPPAQSSDSDGNEIHQDEEESESCSHSLLQLQPGTMTPSLTAEAGILQDITNLPTPSRQVPQPLSHVSDRWCTKGKDLLTAPTTLCLEDLIPAGTQTETTAIRLAIHPTLVGFPSNMEILLPVCPQTVAKQLEEYGHRQQDFLLLPLPAEQDAFQFAILPNRTLDGGRHHYVMIDSMDLEQQAIWGTSTHFKTDIEYMRELSTHRTGRIVITSQAWIVYEDTTVAERITETPPWHVIETAPQTLRTHDTISQHLSSHVEETGCHLVKSPMPCADIKEIFKTADCLSTDLSHLDLPEAILTALSDCVPARGPFDRLRIYVDGSSDPAYKHWDVARVTCDGKPDAWAFVVLGEYYPTAPLNKTTFTFIGYAAHPVCYERDLPSFAGAETIGSDIAEKEGLLWSGLWRIAYNSTCPTLFLSDSTVAGEFAMGRMGTTSKVPGMTHRLTRGVFQTLESFLPGDALALRHVRGHHGEVWNELCDGLAKYTANHVEWRKRQNLDLRQWATVLPHLWMYFNTTQLGLPPLAEQGFLATPPDLPNPEVDIEVKQDYRRQDAQIHLSLATANVRTLEGEIHGFHSKVSYLQEQFSAQALNVVGIQEARTQPTFATKSGQYIRMASGSDRGHFGVELWILLPTVGKNHCSSRRTTWWSSIGTHVDYLCEHNVVSWI